MGAAAEALWRRPEIVRHTQRLLDSFRHWTGRELLPRAGTPAAQSRALFEAPVAVVADGTETDPILNYGNAVALELWEMSWEELTRTPSRQTAEPVHQAERARLMAEVSKHGHIGDYRGVRITRAGRRFSIENAVVWIVRDEQETIIGKAAAFDRWTWL